MPEEIHLVSGLALILISAGIVTLLFKWLKQPLVLGYIVAGVLIGPYLDIFPSVIKESSVKEWSEIGIIFLLFALGLDFSFKKLLRVGRSALITASTEIITMFLVGFTVGHLLGWNLIESVFLGGLLSMSSTTIIIKTFDDLGLRSQKFTSIVFGTLVVEDLYAIILMVLLSTVAVSHQFAGLEILSSLVKLCFFLILWFLIGIYLLPTFLRKARKFMNQETLLIISIGLCFGMVVLATSAGFSSALGAFVMGSILAETIEGEHIEKLLLPIKNLFGAIFFVSVGMMVNPSVLILHWIPILVLSILTIFCKSFFSSLGVLISGQTLKTSIRSGFSLAQIGEFAFIIASLGFTLGVMRDFIYPIIVAVSVITTFTTPYFIKFADPFYNWINPKLPNSLKDSLERYSSGVNAMNHESEWSKILKFYAIRITLYTILLSAIVLGAIKLLFPFVTKHLENFPPTLIGAVNSGITILFMSPFLRGLMVNKSSMNNTFVQLWNNNRLNRGGLAALILLRIFIATLFVSIILYQAFKFSYWVGIVFAFAIVCFILFSRTSFLRYSNIEKKFISNLNQKEDFERQKTPLRNSFKSQLSNKNIHLESITVSPDSKFIGMKLEQTPFRKEYGVMIVKIERGSRIVYLPKGEESIFPYDKLLVLGTDEQIERFTPVIETAVKQDDTGKEQSITLSSFIIEEDSRLIGKTILESGIRDAGCVIVGIERGNDSIMNPEINFKIEENDLLWIVGEKEKMQNFC